MRSAHDQRTEPSGDARSQDSEAEKPAGFDFNAVPAIWRLAGLVLSQTAALTALLFYFGWARSRETYAYFGVNVELLDFSVTDYLLRSVNSAFRPLMVLGLVAVGFTVVHSRVSASGQARRMPPILLGAGALLVVAGLAGIALFDLQRRVVIALTVSMTVGFFFIAYADLAWWRRRARPAGPRPLEAQLRTLPLLSLAVLGLFWSVSLYALLVGRERAETLHRQLPSRTEAVVFSKDRLSIAGRGVKVVPQPAGGRYRYRYSGLYLLAEAQDRYFLLPVGWSKGRDTAMVIPETDDIRLELRAPPRVDSLCVRSRVESQKADRTASSCVVEPGSCVGSRSSTARYSLCRFYVNRFMC